MALIPPFFLDCVTAIGFPDANGLPSFAATGFLFGKLVVVEPPDKNQYRIYLITNRHVFENKSSAVIRFNTAGIAPAKTYTISLIDNLGKPLYSIHPDPEIDIAVIGINIQLLNQHGIQFHWFESDHHVLDLSRASQIGVSEGDGLFVLGFPMGEVGGNRNYVISRQGSIARIRDVLAKTSKFFLADASIYPGNSGGPVVTKPEALSITGTQANSKADLLGIVSGYMTYKDIAISSQTNKPRVIFEENSGLAVVFPVDYIIEVVDIADAVLLSRTSTSSSPSSSDVA